MLLGSGLFQPFPLGNLGLHQVDLALRGYDKLHRNSQDVVEQELYTLGEAFKG